MKRLSNNEQIRGIGSQTSSNFVNREGDVCMYHRTDGPYEVFLVQVRPKETIGERKYPEREVYPSNEDFGKTAWCYTLKNNAEDKFKRLCDGR
ncbi:MAG: hypothetical protein KAS32_09435 [Candidatus Peribacteraceae bacterium]|nr:hypothetical protein [Candidatus Peribacteraceae bacterium]